MRYFYLAVLLAALAGCGSRPECQENPPPYLKGTVYDCQAMRAQQSESSH